MHERVNGKMKMTVKVLFIFIYGRFYKVCLIKFRLPSTWPPGSFVQLSRNIWPPENFGQLARNIWPPGDIRKTAALKNMQNSQENICVRISF